MAKGSFSSDGKGRIDDPTSEIWYHGSPLQITVLAAGSSITRNRQLAVGFSHKPTQLSVNDSGDVSHNGTETGYLYAVDERIGPNEIEVHPSCLEEDPWEWVTRRPLRLRMLEKTCPGRCDPRTNP